MKMQTYLEFEKNLAEIDGKAQELRALDNSGKGINAISEASALEKKSEQLLKDLYGNLSAWRKCQVARHALRPHSMDYINQPMAYHLNCFFLDQTTLKFD